MKPYVKQQDRDATHPNGKPTPKFARKRADKKAVRQANKAACTNQD